MNWNNTSHRAPGALGTGSTHPYEPIIKAVDSFPELKGAGIVWVMEDGTPIEVRGGPRQRWVWITPKGHGPLRSSGGLDEEEFANDELRRPKSNQTPGFWDRWGDSVLSCGSAAATGVVIYLSGGVAGFWVGAFAVNSALLCGTSVGKGIYYDEWQEFSANGGDVYKAWLTAETFLNLADLANGAKGALSLIKSWERAGKLARLSKALKGKNVTRANLLKIIQEIDPGFRPNLSAKGAQYISKGKLITVGRSALEKERFISLINQQARVIAEGIGVGLTSAASPGNFTNSQKTWDIWMVDYR